MKSSSWKLIAAIALLVFGIAGRMLLRDLPNIETLTTTMLLAGSFLGARYAMWIAGIAIIATDLMIGNDMIFLFTWSAWIVIAVSAVVLRRWKSQPGKFTVAAFSGGVLATIAFFLWTNFGVWAISGMYDQSLSGLLASYVAGLPFLRNQLIGNAVIVPVVAFAASTSYVYLKSRVPTLATQPVHESNSR